jgi:hypothetical protein
MPVKKQQQIKKEKIPKMRKARVGRAGRAGRAPRSAAGKAGQKQSQKLIVQLGEKNPFGFSQQQGLTLQDLINFEATRGQRKEEKQVPLTTGSNVGPGPSFLEPEISRPNIGALGSRLLNPSYDFTPEPGSLELLKSKLKEKELKSDSVFTPIFTEEPGSLEIMKSQMRPKPVLTEEAGSLEIMKSQMRPKPVLTEEAGTIELNKSKKPRKRKPAKVELVEVQPAETETEPAATVEEVFNRPITTKSLFEQIAARQPPAESYPDIPPYTMEIIPKPRAPRKDKGVPRGSIKEKAFAEGVEQGIDIGIPTGRDIQNKAVMDVEQMQARKIKPGQMTLVSTIPVMEPSFSSSPGINFA